MALREKKKMNGTSGRRRTGENPGMVPVKQWEGQEGLSPREGVRSEEGGEGEGIGVRGEHSRQSVSSKGIPEL